MPVLPALHLAGERTLTLSLSSAVSAVIDDGVASGTIVRESELPEAAWRAGFVRVAPAPALVDGDGPAFAEPALGQAELKTPHATLTPGRIRRERHRPGRRWRDRGRRVEPLFRGDRSVFASQTSLRQTGSLPRRRFAPGPRRAGWRLHLIVPAGAAIERRPYVGRCWDQPRAVEPESLSAVPASTAGP